MVTGSKRHIARLSLGALAIVPLSAAWTQDDRGFGDTWGIHASVSYAAWDGLGDVQPVGRGGPFETSGTGIEFGGYTSLTRWGPARVLVGAELGFLGFNSDVIFDSDPKAESAMETTYITTSAKFRFGDPGSRYLDLDVGLGWYQADTKYIDCAVIAACFGADVSSSTPGWPRRRAGHAGAWLFRGCETSYRELRPD